MTRYVEIELDRPRRLRYDINALADLEEALGVGLGAALSGERMGIRTLRAMLWAGLRHEDPMLTIREAGELLNGYLERHGNLEGISQAINRALEASGIGRKAEPEGN